MFFVFKPLLGNILIFLVFIGIVNLIIFLISREVIKEEKSNIKIQRSSFRKYTKLRQIFLLLLSAIAFSSCSNESWYIPPTDEVVSGLSQKDLEQVDSTLLENARTVFSWLLDSTLLTYSRGTFWEDLDLQSDLDREIAQEFPSELSVYRAKVKNDSSLVVTLYSPSLESVAKNDVLAHEFMYTFHSNGDVTIRMGNMVSDDNFDNSFIKIYIHRSSKILCYRKNDFAWNNFYVVTSDGQLSIGSDYGVLTGGKGVAKRTVESFLFCDIKEIQGKLK